MPILRTFVRFWIVVAVLAVIGICSPDTRGSLRRVQPGQEMPSFSLEGLDGREFTYDPNYSGVLGIVMMKAGQPQLARIAADLEPILKELHMSGKSLTCVGVISGPDGEDFLRNYDPRGHSSFPLLLDQQFHLWGKLGVIAAPTVVVVGADHRVRWAKAGYGYDFVSSFHAQLAGALGLQETNEASTTVVTLSNTSTRARLERHVHMARAMVKKGHLQAAVAELRKAQSLDPNALDILFEFGELLCRTGDNDGALEVVAEVKAQTDQEEAHMLLISGWAKRQLGQLDAAESLLTEASKLDGQYARIPYELGKVYQAKGDFEKAAYWYRRSLKLLFDEPVQVESSPQKSVK